VLTRATSTATANPPLVVRPRPAWYLLVLLSLAAVAFGLYAYSVQLRRGDIATGLRTPGSGGAAWAFYIVFYVYFVGVSFAGITVASMARLFHIDTLKPVTRLAELLTVVALIVGAMMVLADLGRPLHGLRKLPMLARPSSPFYGTFTLVVSGYLFSSLIFFFLAGRSDAATMARTGWRPLRPLYKLWASGHRGRDVEHARHYRTSFWLALTIIPLLVVAHSTLGFIFGIQAGRPGWFSALQGPAFVVLAGVSGTAALILLAILCRWLFHLEERIPVAAIRWLGNFMWMLTLVYLYFIIVEELTSTYAAPGADRTMAHEIVEGRFAPSFWVAIGCMLLSFGIPFVLYLTNRTSLWLLAVAAIAANIAAVIKRLLLVVPSQTHGGLMKMQAGMYTPTWVEVGVVIGAAGLLALAILVFGRIFPLVPTRIEPARVKVHIPFEPLRTGATVMCALGSLLLIAIGLSDSFRMWSGGEYDPRLPYAPVIFATGVILLFSSAIVYETFPLHRRQPVMRSLLAGSRRISARASFVTSRGHTTRRKS